MRDLNTSKGGDTLKISDLIIDPRSLGDSLLLVDVSPSYEYKNNNRTDTIIGYKYTVAMPDKGLDKIGVKIEGKKLMETPDSFVEVVFNGLELFLYMMNGQPQIGARATGISLVKEK